MNITTGDEKEIDNEWRKARTVTVIVTVTVT